MVLGGYMHFPAATRLPDATFLILRKATLRYIGTALISLCLAEGEKQRARFSSEGYGTTRHCGSLQETIPSAGYSQP